MVCSNFLRRHLCPAGFFVRDAKHSLQIARMCVCFIFQNFCAALYAEAYVTILSIYVVDQTWTITNLVVHEVVERYDFRIRQIPKTAALVGLKRNGRSQRFASARYDGSSENPIEAIGSRPVHK